MSSSILSLISVFTLVVALLPGLFTITQAGVEKLTLEPNSKTSSSSASVALMANGRSYPRRLRRPPIDRSQPEIDHLRTQILAKLGNLDPMMCLPKALCGLSATSAQHDRIHSYLQQMQTVVVRDDGNSNNKRRKPQPQKKRPPTPSAILVRRPRPTASAQSESVESDENDDSGSHIFVKEDNKSGGSSEEDDEEEDDEETQSEEDYKKYIVEKAEMDDLLNDEMIDKDADWWHHMPNSKHPLVSDHQPSNLLFKHSINADPTTASDSWWNILPNWMSSSLPSISWGFGQAKDVFSDDPFFSSFNKRSLEVDESVEGESGRGFMNGYRSKTRRQMNYKNPHRLRDDAERVTLGDRIREMIAKREKEREKKRKEKEQEKQKQQQILMDPAAPTVVVEQLPESSAVAIDATAPGSAISKEEAVNYLIGMKREMSTVVDPVRRFTTAIEIGKTTSSPENCDFIFNGCPVGYEEVLRMIDETRKEIRLANMMHNTVHKHVIPITRKGKHKIPETVIRHQLPTGEGVEISLKRKPDDEQEPMDANPLEALFSSDSLSLHAFPPSRTPTEVKFARVGLTPESLNKKADRGKPKKSASSSKYKKKSKNRPKKPTKRPATKPSKKSRRKPRPPKPAIPQIPPPEPPRIPAPAPIPMMTSPSAPAPFPMPVTAPSTSGESDNNHIVIRIPASAAGPGSYYPSGPSMMSPMSSWLPQRIFQPFYWYKRSMN